MCAVFYNKGISHHDWLSYEIRKNYVNNGNNRIMNLQSRKAIGHERIFTKDWTIYLYIPLSMGCTCLLLRIIAQGFLLVLFFSFSLIMNCRGARAANIFYILISYVIGGSSIVSNHGIQCSVIKVFIVLCTRMRWLLCVPVEKKAKEENRRRIVLFMPRVSAV